MQCLDPLATEVPSPQPTLRAIFRVHRWRILGSYGLFALENLLRLAQPLFLGLAINGLLRGHWGGLLLFGAQHLTHLLSGTLRRMYDTRVFAAIYTEMATRLVLAQHQRQVAVSHIAARSQLSRALVEFFEQDLPLVVRAAFSIAGALVFLAWYDGLLVLFCLVLALPAWLLNRVYSRRTFFYNGRLHDEMEREVTVLATAQPTAIRSHYDWLARWRIKLSDWEALNFGLMELFILALMAATLVRVCSVQTTPGDIFAVFRYLLLFAMGLDSVPLLVQQVSRLRDISLRLSPEKSPQAEEC